MTKDEFWGLKVSETMDRKARIEAERRGMNLSEFVRHCVFFYFDQRDKYNRQNDEQEEPCNSNSH